MILLMPPYATTAAMVGEVDLAMVVVKRSKCKALERCFSGTDSVLEMVLRSFDQGLAFWSC